MHAVNVFVSIAMISVMLSMQAASDAVAFYPLPEQKTGNRIGWLFVPEKSDSVLVRIDKWGNLVYINGITFEQPAAYGLFLWKSHADTISAGVKYGAIMRVAPDAKQGYVWNPENKSYAKLLANGTMSSINTYKSRSIKKMHPSHSVEMWVKKGAPSPDLFLKNASKGPEIVAADKATKADTVSDSSWTPLHQVAYNALISGDVSGALQAVHLLKADHKRIDVIVPASITKDTLYGIAWSVNDDPEYPGILERQPGWAELMQELKS